MHQRLTATLATLGVGALTTVLGLTATPAAAAPAAPLASCSPYHCYGLIQWVHENVNGARIDLTTTNLRPADPPNQFTTSEYWLIFDSPSGSTATYWLEFGVINGVWCNSAMSWFSGINRPSSGFTLQCHGAATESSTTYPLRMEEPANGTWNLFKNNVKVTSYTGAPAGTNRLDAGHETTTTDTTGSMTAGNLGFRYQSTGKWADGWVSTNWPAPTDNPNLTPCYSQWVSKPMSMLARCNLTAVAGAPASRTALPPLKEAQRLAGLLRSPSVAAAPTAVQTVDTTSGAVLAKLGVTDPVDRAVTVIQTTGDFNGSLLPRAAGAAAPTGKVLTTVFDRATGAVLAVNLSDQATVNLATLGSVQTR
jgi:hypothetical protein